MADKDSAQDVIEAYRKRQQRAKRAPLMLGIAAVLLIIGAAVIIFWLTGEEIPTISLFASETPTITITITSTPVPPTETPTSTSTEVPPTITLEPTSTPTLSGPAIYTAEEGDSLYSIAEKFAVDIVVLIEVNRERLNLDPGNPVLRVGDQVFIPAPDTELPTATPLPAGLPRGYEIEYMVQTGDALEFIAKEFNSTVEDILETNEDLENPNEIYVGQILIIRVNLVTPEPTEEGEPPVSTPGTFVTLTPQPSVTPGD